MKTADLIPLILLQLKDGDKYGLEFSKGIEEKSDGKIIVKQPTLYTILKKLEKSKFITSYWLDSEIGGKRHYYKLTQNGLNQVQTLPDISVLINSILTEDSEEDNENNNDKIASDNTQLSKEEIEILPTSPIESVIPSSEVFSNEKLDNLTEIDINHSNTTVLKQETKQDSSFATNENVSQFVNKTELPKADIKDFSSNNISHYSLDLPEVQIETERLNDIKYVEYKNFSKSHEHIYAKNVTKRVVLSSFISSLYIILATIINVLVVNLFKPTPIYYVTLIIGLIVAIFFPVNALLYSKRNYFKLQESKYDFTLKKSLLFDAVIFLSILLICISMNLLLENNTFTKLLEIKNYANFYAPLLIASSTFANTIVKYALLKHLLK